MVEEERADQVELKMSCRVEKPTGMEIGDAEPIPLSYILSLQDLCLTCPAYSRRDDNLVVMRMEVTLSLLDQGQPSHDAAPPLPRSEDQQPSNVPYSEQLNLLSYEWKRSLIANSDCQKLIAQTCAVAASLDENSHLQMPEKWTMYSKLLALVLDMCSHDPKNTEYLLAHDKFLQQLISLLQPLQPSAPPTSSSCSSCSSSSCGSSRAQRKAERANETRCRKLATNLLAMCAAKTENRARVMGVFEMLRAKTWYKAKAEEAKEYANYDSEERESIVEAMN